MAVQGGVTQVYQTNRYGPLPLQLWKTLVTVPAAHTSVSVECPKVSGTIVAVWIDPVVLAVSATIKGYLSDDGLATLTPALFLDYTAPNPVVETRSALAARMRACGRLTIDVASAVAGNSFYLYVWVDPNADTSVAGSATGDTAHDAADSGNPVKIGGKASAAAPTAVNEGDRVNASYTLQGEARVVVDTLPDITVVSPTVLFAVISLAATGTVVAADATHKIRVLSWMLVPNSDVSINWENGTTDISGVMALKAGAEYGASSALGLFETSANALLGLTLGGSVQVSGTVSYILV